jgi:hypothetical protein
MDISRAGLGLKSGDKVTGVMVMVAEGAASLRGKVVTGKEGAGLPSRLRVHLAPVDAALANDVLRYAEALMNDVADSTTGNTGAEGQTGYVKFPIFPCSPWLNLS